jgi:alanine racemase
MLVGALKRNWIVVTESISSAADVAVLKANISGMGIRQIAEGRRAAISGRPVVLLGYPTALDAILARAGAETLQSIAATSKGDPKQVMEELARRNLIRPVTTHRQPGVAVPNEPATTAAVEIGRRLLVKYYSRPPATG